MDTRDDIVRLALTQRPKLSPDLSRATEPPDEPDLETLRERHIRAVEHVECRLCGGGGRGLRFDCDADTIEFCARCMDEAERKRRRE